MIRNKFQAARAALAAALIERDAEIDLVFTALVANEHVLLVGPPGCAKSLLLDTLTAWCHGSRFGCLLTKFTTPEEVFGPISLKGLKEDRFVRVTAGKFPEAQFAFLDEIFKASSAILNALLRALNERQFDRGDGVVTIPLELCVAASNEWPSPENGGRELGAMFDRFLLRRHVRPIASAAGRARLLWGRDHTPTLPAGGLSVAELNQARAEAKALPWSAEGMAAAESILHQLATEGIRPGDRRQFKAIRVAQAAAWLAGDAEVRPDHLEVWADVLWDDPAEQPMKCAEIVGRIANPIGAEVNSALVEAEQVIAACDLRDMGKCIAACKKLGEIRTKVGAIAHAKAVKAKDYITDQLKKIKAAATEAA